MQWRVALLQEPFAAGSVPASRFLCPALYEAGMKMKYLLILEGETGKGFSAWLPDLPGVYAAGDSRRQVKALAKEAAADELSERDTVPTPQFRTDRQIALLLDGIVTGEQLSTTYMELEVPEALLAVKKPCRHENLNFLESQDFDLKAKKVKITDHHNCKLVHGRVPGQHDSDSSLETLHAVLKQDELEQRSEQNRLDP